MYGDRECCHRGEIVVVYYTTCYYNVEERIATMLETYFTVFTFKNVNLLSNQIIFRFSLLLSFYIYYFLSFGFTSSLILVITRER